ncbi:hypothetical protein Syun_027172 [Stephania yunnanensis]|uniref:non-specific serine/threonine protein kinase n=1 Tax=Stephania yunnanensis TaxID=152371 RepID=A0AAP0EF77_9MAGN
MLLKLALLLLITFFTNNSCSATDSITQTNSLIDGETLLSDRETFALGFFSPGNSKNRYIGIWYNRISEQTVIWVANRDNPVTNSSSGVLQIDGDTGNLSIFDGNSSTPVWSTNISIPISPPTNSSTLFYKLLDTGNLVLQEQNRGDSPVLWQSFDYPTNTLIPGMKMGINLKTGLNWSLTSWKSRDDPSTGDYIYSLDQTGSPEFFLKKGSALIWRSGPWNGKKWSGVPEMSINFIFNYTFVNNKDAIYYTYTMYNTSIFSIFSIGDAGIVQRSTWVEADRRWNRFWFAPIDRCDNYKQCGDYGICNSNRDMICSCLPGFEPKSAKDWALKDGLKGCVRKREVLCGNGDGFLKLESVKVPDASNARVDMSLGIKDCEIQCRSNCSCTGYAVADINGEGSGCIAWFEELADMKEYAEGGQGFFVRVDAIELANAMRRSKGSMSRKKVVLICVLVVVGVLMLGSAFYYLYKKGRRRGMVQRGLPMSLFTLASSETNEEANAKYELSIFDLDSVKIATENFSLANKLGTGGFGSVYKGKLSDGREIAVKRLSKNSVQGMNELKNEVVLIARLQHRNLVQILGCCLEEEEQMLIYEYVPNKSLDLLLFDRTRHTSLDWKMRSEIILGIARGVLYLHQDSRLRIIHRDLKASNILLDAEMKPKISDFGLARIFGSNQSQANTNRVIGTYGYMAPEYAMDGLFSIKSDVFSFGVLLLEIISGKKNNGYYYEDPSMNLIKHAWELWKDNRPLELVDPSMANSFPEQEVAKFIQVAILCVQENAKDRPTMSSVIFMLGNETSTIPAPKQPAFVLMRLSTTYQPLIFLFEPTFDDSKGTSPQPHVFRFPPHSLYNADLNPATSEGDPHNVLTCSAPVSIRLRTESQPRHRYHLVRSDGIRVQSRPRDAETLYDDLVEVKFHSKKWLDEKTYKHFKVIESLKANGEHVSHFTTLYFTLFIHETHNLFPVLHDAMVLPDNYLFYAIGYGVAVNYGHMLFRAICLRVHYMKSWKKLLFPCMIIAILAAEDVFTMPLDVIVEAPVLTIRFTILHYSSPRLTDPLVSTDLSEPIAYPVEALIFSPYPSLTHPTSPSGTVGTSAHHGASSSLALTLMTDDQYAKLSYFYLDYLK